MNKAFANAFYKVFDLFQLGENVYTKVEILECMKNKIGITFTMQELINFMLKERIKSKVHRIGKKTVRGYKLHVNTDVKFSNEDLEDLPNIIQKGRPKKNIHRPAKRKLCK